MEGIDRANEAVKGLKSAAGFIRRELSHRLTLRYVPQLILRLPTALSTVQTSAEF